MTEALSGLDIGKIMSEEGTVVKCVLLRCRPAKSEGDSDAEAVAGAERPVSTMSVKELKAELRSHGVDADASAFVEKDELIEALEEARSSEAAAAAREGVGELPSSASAAPQSRESAVPLTHLISEISVDTTPKKSMVAAVLGGEFTFLGQYESEGVMVMVRRPDWDDDEEGGEGRCEGGKPPVNPHRLHPPLDGMEVRGDILLMRVAETEEDLDRDRGGDDEGEDREAGRIRVPSSEEFFLDYTKEEYLEFAARTDVVWEEPEGEDDEDEDEAEEDRDAEEEETLCKTNGSPDGKTDSKEEHDDPPYDPEASSSDEEYDSEEHQIGMMNLILGQILRKFHEEHGRGPNTLELLDMRKALADRLGVEVPEVDEEACDWDRKVPTPKRHNKKVVVDEERNECETIECGEPHQDEVDGEQHHGEDGEQDEEEEGSLKRPADVMENGVSEGKDHEQPSEAAEIEIESRELKRPVDAVENGESECNEPAGKKAKLDVEACPSENGDS